MRAKSLSDAGWTFVAWLPFLAVIVAVMWVLAVGVLHLELSSNGTEFVVTNAQSDNQLDRLPQDPEVAAMTAQLGGL